MELTRVPVVKDVAKYTKNNSQPGALSGLQRNDYL